MSIRTSHTSARRQRGFTLIEILVALMIGLFLLAGLFTILSGTRRTYGDQLGMTQLQDNQRFAMSVLNDVVQAAGYFPDPTVNTVASDLPPTGVFVTPGQPLFGTHTGTATPDSISVQFLTGPKDTTINCLGGQNPSVTNQQLYVNTFSVDQANNLLQCSVNGANPVTLVNGVNNMQILYGITSNGSTVQHDVDTYKYASDMNAADWMNVTSVQITLQFNNPMYATRPLGSTTPQYISFTRVMAVMARAGVTT